MLGEQAIRLQGLRSREARGDPPAPGGLGAEQGVGSARGAQQRGHGPGSAWWENGGHRGEIHQRPGASGQSRGWGQPAGPSLVGERGGGAPRGSGTGRAAGCPHPPGSRPRSPSVPWVWGPLLTICPVSGRDSRPWQGPLLPSDVRICPLSSVSSVAELRFFKVEREEVNSAFIVSQHRGG